MLLSLAPYVMFFMLRGYHKAFPLEWSVPIKNFVGLSRNWTEIIYTLITIYMDKGG